MGQPFLVAFFHTLRAFDRCLRIDPLESLTLDIGRGQLAGLDFNRFQLFAILESIFPYRFDILTYSDLLQTAHALKGFVLDCCHLVGFPVRLD